MLCESLGFCVARGRCGGVLRKKKEFTIKTKFVPDRKQVIGIGLVNIATLTWATNMTLGRWLRSDIGPLTLAAARFLIAAICYALVLQKRPPAERQLGQDRWPLVGMALTMVIFGPALYLGLRYTTTVNATLINGFGPIITGLLAALIIREPMTGRQVVGAVVGLGGVLVLISEGAGDFWQGLVANSGNLIVLAAVALWGVYSVFSRQITRHRSALSATALSTFLGLPLLLLAAGWELAHTPVEWTPTLLLSVLYIGAVPTVVGFWAWNAGVQRMGASGAMVFYNTLPLYGALMGWLLLNENIGPNHWVGGALIIGGALLAGRK